MLLAAALAMVLVLTGGREESRSRGRSTGAGNPDAQLMAPPVDEANLGLGRTILQIQGRRSAPVAGTAILPGNYLLALALAAVAVLLNSERGHTVLLPSQPAPRGPPAG